MYTTNISINNSFSKHYKNYKKNLYIIKILYIFFMVRVKCILIEIIPRLINSVEFIVQEIRTY